MKTKLAIASTALVLSMGATAHAQGQPLTARVHIDGSPGAVLEAYDAYEWHVACVAPCDRRVPVASAYRIAGPDVQPSKPFSLAPEGEAHLSVNAASRGLHVLGVLLVPLGAGSMAVSLGLLIVGSIKYACSDCIDGLADTTMVNWGWGLLAGGLVGLVTGVTLLQTTRTKVTLWGEPTPYVNVHDVALVREKRVTPNNALGWPVFAVSF